MHPQNVQVAPLHIRAPPSRSKENIFSGIFWLGIFQLFIGIVCVILQTAAIVLDSEFDHLHSGNGYWCGIFFILAGVFGIVGGKKKNQCMVITFLVMSILAAMFALSLLIAAGLSVAWYDVWHDDFYFDKDHSAHLAVAAMMLFFAILEGIIAIIASAFACAGICGSAYSQPTTVIFTQSGQSGVITSPTVYPQSYPVQNQGVVYIQQGAGYPQVMQTTVVPSQPMTSTNYTGGPSAPPQYVQSPPAYWADPQQQKY